MPLLLASHLDLLVCPVCYSPLALGAEVVNCTGCLRRYPIVDGLPVLIASRALAPKDVLTAAPESAS
jgi:uncharacterized protein YbaR (Trm112 family)